MTTRSLRPTIARGIVLSAALALAAACKHGDKNTAAAPASPPQIADEGGATAAGAAAVGVTAASVDGSTLYGRCATCHQPLGNGIPVYYPPLAGSEWATSNPAIPIRIVLHGLEGPITVNGKTFNSVMGAYGGTGAPMNDAEVAAVLTYVRKSWGNHASPVTAEQVAQERAATLAQTVPLAVTELEPLR